MRLAIRRFEHHAVQCDLGRFLKRNVHGGLDVVENDACVGEFFCLLDVFFFFFLFFLTRVTTGVLRLTVEVERVERITPCANDVLAEGPCKGRLRIGLAQDKSSSSM